MERYKLDRLSELTAISRTRELTDDEKSEREELRSEYRAAVVGSLMGDLEHTTIVNPDGTRVKVSDRRKGKSGNK